MKKQLVSCCCMLFGMLVVGVGHAAPPVPAPVPAAVAGPVTVQVGKASVTAIQDRTGEMRLSLFRGGSEEAKKAAAPEGTLATTVNVFLVRLNGHAILVDTGYGRPDSALPAALRTLGVDPAAIDMVLLTHMHGDHVGGLVRDGKAVFPKAHIRVSAPELDFWTGPALASSQEGVKRTANLVASVLAAYGPKVRPFAFDDLIVPGIRGFGIAGHTPGHAMFALSSGGKGLIFWGDTVHAAALQFADPEMSAMFDMDMPQSIAARRKMMELAADEGVPVAGAHLPFPGIGRVFRTAGDAAFTYQPQAK